MIEIYLKHGKLKLSGSPLTFSYKRQEFQAIKNDKGFWDYPHYKLTENNITIKTLTVRNIKGLTKEERYIFPTIVIPQFNSPERSKRKSRCNPLKTDMNKQTNKQKPTLTITLYLASKFTENKPN